MIEIVVCENVGFFQGFFFSLDVCVHSLYAYKQTATFFVIT